jgi:eukaryotic-like serine/threonine-protein kinase
VPETPLTRPPAPSAFFAGQRISGRYRLEHRIASGGMAEVWQAADEVLGRHVAVKILHPHLAADDAFVARFRTEAVAAARLHHPSIVAIYDTCHDDGVEAIVMELVRGTTLRDQLDGRVVLEPHEVVHVGAEVADALAAAHRAGLVHRDIKPANILLCGDDRVMVTDFGIAKIRDDPDSTQTGTMLGTVKYLAPEQVRGDPVDGRTDLYALGVVLFEALCSRPPFSGDSPAATALARLQQPPPRPSHLRPTIPAGLERVILRCLQLEPGDRFQSADDLRATLLEPATLRGDDDLTFAERTPALVVADPTASWSSTAPAMPATAARDPAQVEHPMHSAWLRPVLAVGLVCTALVLAFLLLDQTAVGRRLFGFTSRGSGSTSTSQAPVSSQPLAIQAIHSFDPQGTGIPGENDSQLPLAVDGRTGTAWSTESYRDRHFGNLKRGVGVYVTLTQETALRQLAVVSPTQQWSASVYVANGPDAPTTLTAWGAPVAQKAGIAGSTVFDLHGRTGRYVLLWITDLGDGPPLVRTSIDELRVQG